jgi:hypothetical protein
VRAFMEFVVKACPQRTVVRISKDECRVASRKRAIPNDEQLAVETPEACPLRTTVAPLFLERANYLVSGFSCLGQVRRERLGVNCHREKDNRTNQQRGFHEQARSRLTRIRPITFVFKDEFGDPAKVMFELQPRDVPFVVPSASEGSLTRYLITLLPRVGAG